MSLSDVLDKLPDFQDDEILKTFVKGYDIINRPLYRNIVCSISGGSDSDIMLDIIHRVDEQKKVHYVWFDTGLEYQATKDHLLYLEDIYKIQIMRKSAIKPIPICVREFGQPFISKFVSSQIERLQKAEFDFSDMDYERMLTLYPKSCCDWWCNKVETSKHNFSQFNISYNKYLKEYMIANPPTFKISSKCCDYAKKLISHGLIKSNAVDLMITGVRKSEGGIRSAAYKSCFTQGFTDTYRPLFWFDKWDKIEYDLSFNIQHSACYTKYDFVRTGCVCCPYGKDFDIELATIEKFEPKLAIAAKTVFRDSFEYTRKYRQFVKDMKKGVSKPL